MSYSRMPSGANLPSRTLNRAATTGEFSPNSARLRRGSTFSDTVSDAHNSIRSSTGELLLPRVHQKRPPRDEDSENESHWHSAPLALALLPAVAGVFFQNGSAFITDVTLLILAAIFLNWSVRLPW